MTFSKNKHSWSQYRYTEYDSAMPYKMWIKGHDKIYETPTGFTAANENGPIDREVKTFDEAEKMIEDLKTLPL